MPLQTLSSRKLAGIIAAILGVVIHPSTLTEATEVVLTAIVAISGLGGFQVWRQSLNDKFPVYKVGPDETVERIN